MSTEYGVGGDTDEGDERDEAEASGGREAVAASTTTPIVVHDIPVDGAGNEGLGGGSPGVTLIFRKAAEIARQLNHKELRIAHVLLAMSLTTEGRKQLSQVADDKRVREGCWRDLGEIGPMADTPARVIVSDEIRLVNAEAEKLTRAENEESLRVVQVKYLLRAITEGPVADRFSEIITGTTDVPTPEQARQMIRELKRSTDSELPEIRSAIGEDANGIRSLHQRLSSAEDSMSGILASAMMIQRSLGVDQVSGRALHERVAAVETSTSAGLSHFEKRIKNVKHWVIAGNALMVLGFGSILVAVITYFGGGR